jgi:hypothetical protein
MSSRLRSLNSTKISFFAFQDIIVCVSGILVLVTLILATELDRTTSRATNDADPELERKLSDVLRQQAETDAKNQNLQGLLAAADTAPAAEKLELDIAQLRAELTEERMRHASVTEQLAASKSAIEARDRTLGLTDLEAQIKRTIQEAESLVRQESEVRKEMASLEQQVASVELKLLKLREREGKLWLIPDKSSTTKEPILATVSSSGVKVERFDHPADAQEFSRSSARSGFESYLVKARPVDQYVVFLVKPSGIELFERLVQVARAQGFEVGFDALEENREIHFTDPPPLDDSPVQQSAPDTGTNTPASNPSQTTFTPTAKPATNSASPPPATSKPVPAPKTKGWWQRLMEVLGIT